MRIGAAYVHGLQLRGTEYGIYKLAGTYSLLGVGVIGVLLVSSVILLAHDLFERLA
jgi:hypothetical protein